jgi:archaellum component FlaC
VIRSRLQQGWLGLSLIQVTQVLVDLNSAYKSRDNDVAKINQHIENIQNAFQQRQSQPNAEELLQDVHKATQRCHKIIKELQMEYQKLSADSVTGLKGHSQVAGRRAAYPFRKSTIQKIEEDIGEIRENLSFALKVSQFNIHNRMEDEISAIRSLLKRTNTSQISSTIRAWLRTPNPSVKLWARHDSMGRYHQRASTVQSS